MRDRYSSNRKTLPHGRGSVSKRSLTVATRIVAAKPLSLTFSLGRGPNFLGSSASGFAWCRRRVPGRNGDSHS